MAAPAPRSGGFSIAFPAPTFTIPPAPLEKSNGRPGYDPAPLPDRDAWRPAGPRPSKSASLTPGLFTRSDQYRGEGLSAINSAQSDQDRRAKPGAGFNLKMPLQ